MEQNWGAGRIPPSISCESGGQDSFNVLKENNGRSALSNSVQNVGEEMPRVFVSFAFSCCGEWLTRKASREEVHLPAKLFPREGFKIRPDRC
jgi:hypothetical protein